MEHFFIYICCTAQFSCYNSTLHIGEQMNLQINTVSKKDGGGYYAYFDDGEIILRPTEKKDLLEIVWLSIDNKEKRKSGLGEKVLKEISYLLNGVKLRP